MEPTLIIIGGGVAGLTAGCYARMNGYRTTILEMDQTHGGLCTSWQRNRLESHLLSNIRLKRGRK